MLWIEVKSACSIPFSAIAARKAATRRANSPSEKVWRTRSPLRMIFVSFHCRQIFCEVEARFAPAENDDFRITTMCSRVIVCSVAPTALVGLFLDGILLFGIRRVKAASKPKSVIGKIGARRAIRRQLDSFDAAVAENKAGASARGTVLAALAMA